MIKSAKTGQNELKMIKSAKKVTKKMRKKAPKNFTLSWDLYNLIKLFIARLNFG
jgi:hypothetical protein